MTAENFNWILEELTSKLRFRSSPSRLLGLRFEVDHLKGASFIGKAWRCFWRRAAYRSCSISKT